MVNVTLLKLLATDPVLNFARFSFLLLNYYPRIVTCSNLLLAYLTVILPTPALLVGFSYTSPFFRLVSMVIMNSGRLRKLLPPECLGLLQEIYPEATDCVAPKQSDCFRTSSGIPSPNRNHTNTQSDPLYKGHRSKSVPFISLTLFTHNVCGETHVQLQQC